MLGEGSWARGLFGVGSVPFGHHSLASEHYRAFLCWWPDRRAYRLSTHRDWPGPPG